MMLRWRKLRQRYREWAEVLKEERQTMTFRQKISMVIDLVTKSVSVFGKTDHMWRRKMRICRNCIIYDRTMRRCRPYTGSDVGCGCYVPFMAKVKKHCWATENVPKEGIGW